MLDSGWRKCVNCGNAVHIMQITCDSCLKNPYINSELQKLNEENEKLKSDNNSYSQVLAINNNYYQSMLALEEQVKELKAENTNLKKDYEDCYEANKGLMDEFKKLRKENQQLKAQSQTCDKVSQVERKPCNKCSGNGGYIIINCSNPLDTHFIKCKECNFERKPHVCPVCRGEGKLPAPSQPDGPEQYTNCHACEKGILWEP
jgi:hypothetical protein